MRFAKWHGIGNDYLLIHERELPLMDGGVRGLTVQQAQLLCDRHFGVGGDGILVMGASRDCDARMLVHNPDGSMAEMCGNGIRMAARWLYEHGHVTTPTMTIETAGGVIRPTVLDDGRVSVDMGRVTTEGTESIELDDATTLTGRVLSVGNPHFVVLMDPDGVAIGSLGPAAERHRRFPDRTNVEFIAVESPHSVRMRVWERGVGETLACGTGACAVGVTSVLDHGAASPVTVHLPGGDLEIRVDDQLGVTMTGPAVQVYAGELDLDQLLAAAPAHRQTAHDDPRKETFA